MEARPDQSGSSESGKGPPRAARFLLRVLLPAARVAAQIGDLDEEYVRFVRPTRGRLRADVWYWRQTLASVLAWMVQRGEMSDNRATKGIGMRSYGLGHLLADARHALRGLRRRPRFAALTVLTLALGVGGASAVYSVVYGTLLRPLPYSQADQLAVFWSAFDWSDSEFTYLEGRFDGFVDVAAYRQTYSTFTRPTGGTSVVEAIEVTANLFTTLGSPPVLGSGFRPGDDRMGTGPSAVVSYAFWQRELGGDPALVGDGTIRLDGREVRVAGVMAPDFYFPTPAVEVWIAHHLDEEDGSGMLALLGRMANGRTAQTITPSLDRITSLLGERFTYAAQWDKLRAPHVIPIRDYLVGDVRRSLLLVLGAMGFILLIACANVAALQVGKLNGRRTEFAVRAAMGAGRVRIAGQLLVESVLVALVAGLLGLGLAGAGFTTLVSTLPISEAQAADLTFSWRALSTGLGMAFVAGLLVSIAPIYSVLRGDLRAGMVGGRGGMGPGRAQGRIEGTLVVAEIALAMILVVGASLLIRSVQGLQALDPGLDPEGVLAIDVVMGSGDYDAAERREKLREISTVLAQLPDVDFAGAIHKLPLRGPGSSSGIRLESRPDEPVTTTYFRFVSGDYFSAMGVELVSGRTFDSSDREDGPLAVVINRALADQYFAGTDPLGERVGNGFGSWATIVGVVENVSVANLTDGPQPVRYIAYEQAPFATEGNTVVVRSRGNVTALTPRLRDEILRVAPAAAIASVTPMTRVFNRAVGQPRQVMFLLSLLGGLALILGAVGVYGVISHLVMSRAREWGLRMALGLEPSAVVTSVLRRGVGMTLLGVGIGVLAALFVGQALASLLYQVPPRDILALSGAAATLLLAGLVAAYLPARWASRVDPIVTLREE